MVVWLSGTLVLCANHGTAIGRVLFPHIALLWIGEQSCRINYGDAYSWFLIRFSHIVIPAIHDIE